MLFWIDIETTGLNPDRLQPIEIDAIITDDQLRPIAQHAAALYSHENP